MIKLGKTLIRCIELIEAKPHITGVYIGQVNGIDIENMRGYLSRLARNGLIVKHRPKGSLVPTFTAVDGWRGMIVVRSDIGNPKKRGPRKKVDPPKMIAPLPMSAGSRGLPKRIINSVWALGKL